MKIFLIILFILIIVIMIYFIKINKNKYNSVTSFETNHTKENETKKNIMQIYIECSHNFIPPLKTIPYSRIQCTTPIEGYECCETKAYLDFIINNYDNPLANIYVFMHGHNSSWHYINPLDKTMNKLINSNYIKEEKYGGYQCFWNYVPTLSTNQKKTIELMKLLFKNTSVDIDNLSNWSYPCCSTFFVHSNQIKKRPKSEYIQMIKNLKKWYNKDVEYKKKFGNNYDKNCGRIYEMMWNRILSETRYVKVPPYCKAEEKMNKNTIPIYTM